VGLNREEVGLDVGVPVGRHGNGDRYLDRTGGILSFCLTNVSRMRNYLANLGRGLAAFDLLVYTVIDVD
jgi:hypothetical protein